MDNFINLAKQGYQAYESSQGQGNQGSQGQQQQQGQYQQQQGQGQQYQQDQQGQDQQYNVQGGAQWNAPHDQSQGAPTQIDHNAAIQQASDDAGSSGDTGLFSKAMSFVNSNSQQHTEPVDSQGVQQAHDQAYNQGNASSLDASGMGGAAAMQILKQFTSGGGGSSGSGGQTQLISMAMSEAAKLFDQSGGGAGGSKQDAVNSAGMTVMKLLVQSKFSGMMGGSNSGGLSSMMGMASQFL